jgi:TonB-dependent starch-binding outer membrane protein SusC
MSSLSLPALVPAGLLCCVLWGCASAGSANDAVIAATPQEDPGMVSQGYGAEAAQDSVPDIGALTQDDIRRRIPGESIEEALEGRVSGVQVVRTGNGISVRIHGPSSFLGSNEPLYVLDGTPIEAGPGGALVGISPYDIESIVVLKDPVNTALYGVRGGNGVILITTIRPGK